MKDLIERQAAIDAFDGVKVDEENCTEYDIGYNDGIDFAVSRLSVLPSAQPEPCEYYALCRHGRDENKLRAHLGFCEYCNEDADGFVTPIEKNGHAFVRFGMNGWEISLSAKGWNGSAKIMYCPMCGRRLNE